jgi:hypothetical protein
MMGASEFATKGALDEDIEEVVGIRMVSSLIS